MFHPMKPPLNKSSTLTVDLLTLIHRAPLIELKSVPIESSHHRA
jgi:hypothetical protein